MSADPPVFGENGAVLNGDTMTDEWRAEHAKNIIERIDTGVTSPRDTIALLALAFLAMTTARTILPDSMPWHRSSLATFAVFMLTFAIMKRVLAFRSKRHKKSRHQLFPSPRRPR